MADEHDETVTQEEAADRLQPPARLRRVLFGGVHREDAAALQDALAAAQDELRLARAALVETAGWASRLPLALLELARLAAGEGGEDDPFERLAVAVHEVAGPHLLSSVEFLHVYSPTLEEHEEHTDWDGPGRPLVSAVRVGPHVLRCVWEPTVLAGEDVRGRRAGRADHECGPRDTGRLPRLPGRSARPGRAARGRARDRGHVLLRIGIVDRFQGDEDSKLERARERLIGDHVPRVQGVCRYRQGTAELEHRLETWSTTPRLQQVYVRAVHARRSRQIGLRQAAIETRRPERLPEHDATGTFRPSRSLARA